MTEWLMYASVEMLLKFCVENFFSECACEKSRAKSTPAHIWNSFKLNFSHWRLRHFTRTSCDDRIHSALVDFSTTKFFKLFAQQFYALCGRPMKPKRTILCVDDNEQSLSI